MPTALPKMRPINDAEIEVLEGPFPRREGPLQ
jgi:hypothetical protein